MTSDPLGEHFRTESSANIFFHPLSHHTCSTHTHTLGLYNAYSEGNLPRNPTRKLTREADCFVGRSEGLKRVRRLKPCPGSMVT